ncbi:uncharacterized protein M421DRAFT_79499 [Didymella exigua CBS 183.55]|uniref:HTH CENPB-type domain-containing protein n=1 Tax=Didymella exigua CBS 183.55 TaxID=1150837 RepID=A0A6A5R256_9PLEO|nr:uncharacterized protein M421DRAFT_79499 [Didymella exigua CBS 183.55]KAF1922131.1 hypothetical protein M421DRAFT_79499 [Didymella exigua CBS 183.55]
MPQQHNAIAIQEEGRVNLALQAYTFGQFKTLWRAAAAFNVADIADKLLAVRGGKPVGKCWPERFVTRSDELKMAFNRAKDRQRIL